MSVTYKKKLIEVALPLEAINAASSREKSIRHGHPSTLHLWWARRPLAACRAVLFAQLVDDPSEHVDTLLADPKTRAAAEAELTKRVHAWEERQGDRSEDAVAVPKPTLSEVVADLERKRLFAIIEELVKWENSTNEEVLERARAEIRRSCGGELPPVYDPFSGGGSIPLEAQRLGLPAYGSDLNPVAVMIGKAMIEIPPKFRGNDPIHPGMPERNHYRNAEGLAEDVKYYGEWMRERALERIGHLYPDVDLPKEYGGGKATVIAWIWARTVPSPDPAFSDVQVPIASSFLLSSKAGKEAWIEPIVDKAAKTISYRIRHGGTKAEIAAAKEGTKAGRGANFRCLISGTAITPDYTKKSGASGRMGETLIAIVADVKGGRLYLPPTLLQEAVATGAPDSWKPDTSLSSDMRAFWTPPYGLRTFGDLFTKRQLVTLNTFCDIALSARKDLFGSACEAGLRDDGISLHEGGCGAQAYADAISLYLAFSISKALTRNCSLAIWESGMGRLAGALGRQALPMQWTFAETNPLAGAGGDIAGTAKSVSEVLDQLVFPKQGSVIQANAAEVTVDKPRVICTDPPYYDNIGYADLSDFYFVWLKKSASGVFPDLLGTLATPKNEEIVAAPHRHDSKDQANSFFMSEIERAFSRISENSISGYPATIYYAFKQSDIDEGGVSSSGWASFLEGVLRSGLTLVATWPVRTEATNALKKGVNALANSVVLVCRKKEASAETVTRAQENRFWAWQGV